MRVFNYVFIGIILLFSSFTTKVEPPKPVGPLPSERQLAWHEMGYYGFLHFNMNTFTNIEWGSGAESPDLFNPTEFDARQWARIAKEAGMKGLILTAKHHDGFCLWPSEHSTHTIKDSPWKDGKGDVVKELSEACAEYGLKMGVYLSPWDRNHSEYGRADYVEDFHGQLRELLTNYGDIFEVWFDGANGGSGYYGGANETRKIDSKTYYEWDKVIGIVRELQPNAVIFGDGGPDVRWVGTEQGFANETNWCLISDEVHIAYPKYKELRSGHEDGTNWVPAECDVSIRPGWYYHPYENHKVKSLQKLVKIYYETIGRNGSLLLNLPLDNRGLVHENDELQLMKLANQIKMDFEENLALKATMSATYVRGGSAIYAPENLIDGDKKSYWATDDDKINSSVTFTFDKPTAINRILLQEYIKLGQRIKAYNIEAEINGEWQTIDSQTTIGYKRILRFETVTTSKFRVNFTDAKASPAISNMALYHAPMLMTEPILSRTKEGILSMTVPEKGIEIYYTLDGSEASTSSLKYSEPFLIDQPTLVNTMAYNPENKQQTLSVAKRFDINKKEWKVIHITSGNKKQTVRMIDEDMNTYWTSSKQSKEKQEIVVDMGNIHQLKGFTYLPMQERWIKGVITHYQFFISLDNKQWEQVSAGEFGNIWNNPVEQKIEFNPIEARYFKLKAIKIHGDENVISVAEIGVITAK